VITPKQNKEEFRHFSVTMKHDGVQNLYRVYEDGSFSEINEVLLRVDTVLKDPLQIEINAEESSLTINHSWGILFEDDLALDLFLEELYFVMEEINEVPKKLRETSDARIITNIDEIFKGGKNGEEKLDDRETKQE
jgi:hypothetical protein